MRTHLTHLLQRAAREAPGAPALTFEGRTWSWAALAQRCARMAGALRNLGLAPDDRVAVLSQNTDKFVELFFAPIWAGGLFVPINPRWAQPEMIACVEDCTPKVLFVDRDHADAARAIAAACRSLTHIVHADDGPAPAGLLDYEEMIEQAGPGDDAGRGGEDLACLFYTGGTTGRSKGVMLTHDNIFANTLGSVAAYQPDPTATYLQAGPIFHLAAGARVFSSALLCAHSVLLRRFDAGEVLAAIEAYGAGVGLFVPTMLNHMLNHPRFSDFDLSSLKQVNYGASPMPQALLRQAMERMPGVRFYQGYGMTEASPLLTVLEPDDHVLEGPEAGRLSSVGRTVYHAEIRIVDTEDREVPPGTVGELVARGPNIMKGYWNLPELTAEALRGGWYHTGDAGYEDEDGYIFLVDRIKDMIVTGGENVYSVEVENAIYRHLAVKDCAVFGVPDKEWGEAVHAVVTLKPDASTSEAELIAHCRALIAGYKCPKSVEIRDEPMPLSGANKILKSELRAPYWVGHATRIV
jgi:long-chain acyl-CoA synthetase